MYMVTYGGGLVGGDKIELQVEVGPGAKLLMLTQVRRLLYTSVIVGF